MCDLTIKDLALQWLYLVQISVRKHTFSDYKNGMRYVIDYLGDLQVIQLTRQTLQEFYCTLANKYTTQITLHVHSVLRIFVNYLIDNDLLLKNPIKGVVLPKKEKYHPVFLDASELQRLLACADADGSEIYNAILLAGFVGLRRGECLALTKQNVDREKKIINVCGSAEYKKGKCILSLPKSEQSYRKLIVSDKLLDRLYAHTPTDCSLFCPYTQGVLHKRFARLLDNNGFAKMRFHDLRHTYASLLLQENVDIKLISARLGHSSVTLTLDTYVHVSTKNQEYSAGVLDELIK